MASSGSIAVKKRLEPKIRTGLDTTPRSEAPDAQAAAPAGQVEQHIPAKTEEPAASKRVALPAMHVEVASGESSRAADRSNARRRALDPTPVLLTNVSQRAVSTPAQAPAVEQTIVAEYPTLARQMKVQGSVLMQALIGADGTIQDLRVISGPAILAVAARQAVLQYHFKPYVQNGQPVETSARVTVNFAIRVLGDVTARLTGSSSNGAY